MWRNKSRRNTYKLYGIFVHSFMIGFFWPMRLEAMTLAIIALLKIQLQFDRMSGSNSESNRDKGWCANNVATGLGMHIALSRHAWAVRSDTARYLSWWELWETCVGLACWNVRPWLLWNMTDDGRVRLSSMVWLLHRSPSFSFFFFSSLVLIFQLLGETRL
jgi:hypothetical protein